MSGTAWVYIMLGIYIIYCFYEAVRFLSVLTAILFSVFFTAVQFNASAALFHVIAGVDVTFGAIFMAFIVWFYVCAGGIRASVWVGAVWFLFAIGPTCVIGNSAFPFAGFPPLWSWQIVWWSIGIVIMWALCFKSELSTVNDAQIVRAEAEKMTVVKGG